MKNARIRGGRIFGATIGAFLGKGLVSLVGNGSIYLIGTGVSLVGTLAAGIATGMFLEGMFGPMIEAASLHGALVGGLLGGVTTGPV